MRIFEMRNIADKCTGGKIRIKGRWHTIAKVENSAGGGRTDPMVCFETVGHKTFMFYGFQHVILLRTGEYVGENDAFKIIPQKT
ncbi:MAG: hypothetical protein A2845_01205 [Candidatus Lloydbacteria bacterium RIFCSPHIGHO2_01_FULL_49_22]|uniref:Uncharacterized protein n=1 Tax=Candidatus Lloydbacteria bacterium RIFCSPHIGHO2_01_FULL_49_22 TaxID=1798658 RepID=A0A1G2CWU3_9BACT|nr:MAG: hypothetical protein A2845_01205 [Candidatus Lloydbacteria bacterium RIFCSPHIGHO2_01_FULL_49_22]OGZ09239.1 MAG: hypothetical protein A3C14_06210 [Candidatus Lloydbacteria bacterium RIFCSPHIGHO2_02_FULL_50_18]